MSAEVEREERMPATSFFRQNTHRDRQNMAYTYWLTPQGQEMVLLAH